jgi:hypothetical protein
MAAEDELRDRLQQAGSYRVLCRGVRRSGRQNVVFAAIMLVLAFYLFNPQGRNALFFYGFVGLACCELAVGLFKWVNPTAEGTLLDGFVLLLFAGWMLGRQALVVAAGLNPNPVGLFFGVYVLLQAVGHFRLYAQLRRLFADRPSPELMAWFDDLVREIRAADPQTDDLAVDLPTRPHLKAKLLGSTAFFVADRGDVAFVAGPAAFQLVRDPTDHGTGRRKALLRVFDDHYPEFQIDDASWDNYEKWLKANPPA